MQWRKACHHWMPEEWRRLLCRNRWHFSVGQSYGKVWTSQVWGEQYLPDCPLPSVKFSGGGLWCGVAFQDLNTASVIELLMLQHTKTSWTISCFHLCGNSLGWWSLITVQINQKNVCIMGFVQVLVVNLSLIWGFMPRIHHKEPCLPNQHTPECNQPHSSALVANWTNKLLLQPYGAALG